VDSQPLFLLSNRVFPFFLEINSAVCVDRVPSPHSRARPTQIESPEYAETAANRFRRDPPPLASTPTAIFAKPNRDFGQNPTAPTTRRRNRQRDAERGPDEGRAPEGEPRASGAFPIRYPNDASTPRAISETIPDEVLARTGRPDDPPIA